MSVDFAASEPRRLRPFVEQLAAACDADRRHHRTRKRKPGDGRRSFFDDPDRFGIAAALAVQLVGNAAPMTFGGKRSEWAAAQHAAALFAPGRGQRVTYSHRIGLNGILAAARFATGPDGNATAARRLVRKMRALTDLPGEWVAVSSCFLSHLNSDVSTHARARARGMLRILGWHELPPAFWRRLVNLLVPSEINGLPELLANDGAPPVADDRGRSQPHRPRGSRRDPETINRPSARSAGPGGSPADRR